MFIINILICDDEIDIVNAIAIYLENEQFNVFKAYNGLECIKIVEEEEVDLVLLDNMMPKLNGMETLNKLREFCNVPVIMLTAKSENEDKVQGLTFGADDYVTKPFHPEELIARIKAQIRRYTRLGSNVEASTIKIGGIELDDNMKVVFVNGEKIRLTPTEYDILKLLMKNVNQVFSPDEIYTEIWSDYSYGVQNTIAVHIRHLREKVEINPKNPRHLKVVWGRGYKFED